MKKIILAILGLFLTVRCSSDNFDLEKDIVKECALPKVLYSWFENQKIIISEERGYSIVSGKNIVFKYLSKSPECSDSKDKMSKAIYFEIPLDVSNFEFIGEQMYIKAKAIFEKGDSENQQIIPLSVGFIQGKKIDNSTWDINIEVNVNERLGAKNTIEIHHRFYKK